MLDPIKTELLARVDRDRDVMITFLGEFVRAKSPNPPGDTREAAACITRFLEARGLDYKIVSPHPEMPNIIAAFDGGAPGRHLVLNGHMDVFPLPRLDGWTHDPWGGEVADGKVWGAGCCDMKQGTASILFAYAYLYELRDRLKGRLTLTAVSDEETFGPWGARHLMDHCPEVLGDCCLNAEPGAPTTVRIGEKAPMWLSFTVKTPGAHAAYTHKSESATKVAARLIEELEQIEDLPVDLPPEVAATLEAGRNEIDRIHLPGAADVMRKFSVNVGTFDGGSMVNMLPGYCKFELDIRLPFGMSCEPVYDLVHRILKNYPQVTMEVMMDTAVPAWSDPDHEIVGYVKANAKQVAGRDVLAITSLAGTDARLWRYKGIPAYSYGTTATNVAMPDEHVDIEEWMSVVKTHLLTIYDYLSVGA